MLKLAGKKPGVCSPRPLVCSYLEESFSTFRNTTLRDGFAGRAAGSAAARGGRGQWRVARPAGKGGAGGGLRGGTACQERRWNRGYGTPSPRVTCPTRARPRPPSAFPLSSPRSRVGPGRVTPHGQERRPGLWNLGLRTPHAGASALKCARQFRQFLPSFHSGYFAPLSH